VGGVSHSGLYFAEHDGNQASIFQIACMSSHSPQLSSFNRLFGSQ